MIAVQKENKSNFEINSNINGSQHGSDGHGDIAYQQDKNTTDLVFGKGGGVAGLLNQVVKLTVNDDADDDGTGNTNEDNDVNRNKTKNMKRQQQSLATSFLAFGRIFSGRLKSRGAISLLDEQEDDCREIIVLGARNNNTSGMKRSINIDEAKDKAETNDDWNGTNDNGNGKNDVLVSNQSVAGSSFDNESEQLSSAISNHLSSVQVLGHVKLSQLQTFIFMGPVFIPTHTFAHPDGLPAGCIVGIAGLAQTITSTATMFAPGKGDPMIRFLPSIGRYLPSFVPMPKQARPLLRVIIESEDPTNAFAVSQLEKGLRLLNKGDPFVEIAFLPSGENMLSAIGELHLERCLKDLKERFAGPAAKFTVSEPVVSFRETLVWDDTLENHSGPQKGMLNNISDKEHQNSASSSHIITDVNGEIVNLKDFQGSCPEMKASILRQICPAASVSTGDLTLVIRALPMPQTLIEYLQSKEIVEATTTNQVIQSLTSLINDHGVSGRTVSETMTGTVSETMTGTVDCNSETKTKLCEGEEDLIQKKQELIERIVKESKVPLSQWKKDFENFWALGPDGLTPQNGRNGISSDANRRQTTSAMQDSSLRNSTNVLVLGTNDQKTVVSALNDTISNSGSISGLTSAVRSAICSGFRLATKKGPMCEEPMHGVYFRVERIVSKRAVKTIPKNIEEEEEEGEKIKNDDVNSALQTNNVPDSSNNGPDSNNLLDTNNVSHGSLITAARDCCLEAFQKWRRCARLVEGILEGRLQCAQGQFGRLTRCLGKRRGEITRADLIEGTEIFNVTFLVPLYETLGIADFLRSNTSGAVSSPQLTFDHWQVLAEDPFFVPLSEEEREEHGELTYEGQGVGDNLAKKIVDKLRERKGLSRAASKIKIAADKQRTRHRKK
eukprot:g4044.t1